MSVQMTISGNNLINDAIQCIQEHEPDDGYYLAFSGGKDSICVYQLAKMAGVKFEAHYHHTTIDPRGVPQFIRKNYPDVIIDMPKYKGERTNFYELVALKGLPRRRIRWCCSILKESQSGKGNTVMVGVRRSESTSRASRMQFYERNGEYILLPIYDWSDADVWGFIKDNNFPYPTLYDHGHKRLGCVMCPLACNASRVRDYLEYPERVRALEIAVSKFLEKHSNSSLTKWGKSPSEIVYTWVYFSPKESAKGTCLGDFLPDDWENN